MQLFYQLRYAISCKDESFKLSNVLPYMIGQGKCLHAFQGSCKEYLFFSD